MKISETQEQTSTELVHLYIILSYSSSAIVHHTSRMQRSCSSCLIRHPSPRVGGTRSYGIVPKPKQSKPSRAIDTPPRPSHNRLDGPSSRSDSGRRREGLNHEYSMRAGESRLSKDGGSARRARVSGYLDNVKSGESSASSTPITPVTTSERLQKRNKTRDDDMTHRYDRRSGESRNQDTYDRRSRESLGTRRYNREPLYPPITPEPDSGSTRRKVCTHLSKSYPQVTYRNSADL